jgi:hypothetical protein
LGQGDEISANVWLKFQKKKKKENEEKTWCGQQVQVDLFSTYPINMMTFRICERFKYNIHVTFTWNTK